MLPICLLFIYPFIYLFFHPVETWSLLWEGPQSMVQRSLGKAVFGNQVLGNLPSQVEDPSCPMAAVFSPRGSEFSTKVPVMTKPES